MAEQDLTEAQEPKEFPPPPTGPELTGFVADLDGATDWPDPPPKPGVDVPYGMRLIPAETVQAGDLIHDRDTFVGVVWTRPPQVPIFVRDHDRDQEWLAHRAVGEHVLASRPSGWDDVILPPSTADTDHLPAWEGGGPSRGELLAGIRPPHRTHDTEASGEDQGTGPGEPA